MHDPIAAARHGALRAVGVQVIVVALVASAYLLKGPMSAGAAGWGGMVMAGGNALAAGTALGGIAPAGAALGRLLLGSMLKWMVALAGLVVGMVAWRFPPLPMLAGLATGLLAYLLALNLDGSKRARVERER